MHLKRALSPGVSQHPIGFTMVEMLVVIAVLSILIAFITPAVMSSYRSAREAEVGTEISQLESAVAGFKTAFGSEPPSMIRLYEKASDTPTVERSKLLKLWPHFNFASNTYDWDGDGTPGEDTTFAELKGAECLVFFLGGITQTDTGSGVSVPVGFSKNPANPFLLPDPAGGEVREGPFFDFKPDRIRPSNRFSAPNVRFLIYVDPLPGQSAPWAPYIYVSSNGGRGYVDADLIAGSQDDLDEVYRTGTAAMAAKFHPKTFQILCAGYDHSFGVGGYFNPDEATSLTGKPNDEDNIVSFHKGRMRP